MAETTFIVIPYRDHEFYLRYGNAVRDLQIIDILFRGNKNVIIVNRPSLPFEIRRINKLKNCSFNDYKTCSSINYNLHHLLYGKRKTVARSYDAVVNKLLKNILKSQSTSKVVIFDFHPYATIEPKSFWGEHVHYWYDMIDNFTKHNRFSAADKELVRRKYQSLADICNFLTGVSEAALEEINISGKKVVIPNGVYFENKPLKTATKVDKQKFGFIGFVTNKFDVEFISRLRRLNFEVVIWGMILDKSVGKRLQSLGCELAGEFAYNQLEKVMETFSIGLLPYLKDKSHDGSPLKLYEYLKYNKVCLTSMDYEYSSSHIVNYSAIKSDDELKSAISRISKSTGSELIAKTIPDEIKLTFMLKKLAELNFPVPV